MPEETSNDKTENEIFSESVVNVMAKVISESPLKGTQFLVMFHYPDKTSSICGSPKDKETFDTLVKLFHGFLEMTMTRKVVTTQRKN